MSDARSNCQYRSYCLCNKLNEINLLVRELKFLKNISWIVIAIVIVIVRCTEHSNDNEAVTDKMYKG